MKIALLQMTSGIEPEANAATLRKAAAEAGRGGAAILFTPEMTGFVDRDRSRAANKIRLESEDIALGEARAAAAREGLWIAVGSLAIDRGDGAWANRSYLIDADGEIAARYDKVHMFDVSLAGGETWQESTAYRPGEAVVVAPGTPAGTIGLTICYDLRFPALFSALGRHSCDVLATPAAFTVPTGRAHWHVLQRARAIEASAFVIAAAQVGQHEDGRTTYGHSLVIDPWGEVLLDMGGNAPGLGFAELDLARVTEVRRQLPSLANRREIAT